MWRLSSLSSLLFLPSLFPFSSSFASSSANPANPSYARAPPPALHGGVEAPGVTQVEVGLPVPSANLLPVPVSLALGDTVMDI